MQNKTIVFFGSSGSGKGTQARLLQEYIENHDTEKKKILYVETGARFREFMQTGSHTANIVKEVLAEGGLLPEFLPIWVWSDFFIKNYTGNEHLILDGLSRRPSEAPVLDSALRFYNCQDIYIIYIKTSREWSKEHLISRGRKDDTSEDIDRRLDWFMTNVTPAMEYFKNRSGMTFVEINGEQSIEEVHKNIVSSINWE